MAERGYIQVHPYDDARIIAGQGTVALEMLEDVPALDVLVIPIGGGGLISGCAIAAKGIKPAIDIVGVEAALYPSMWNALRGKDQVRGGPTLAEGIATKKVTGLTVAIVRELVSDIVLVDEPQLERAVNAYTTLQKTVAEGAGAAGLAALLSDPARFRGKKVGLILSGGNIDPRILASIMVRELERESRIVSFRLTTTDQPGVLGAIASRLGALDANILEVDHRRLFLDVPAKGATHRRHRRDARRRARRADSASARRRRLSADTHRAGRHRVTRRQGYFIGRRARRELRLRCCAKRE